jgi:DNA polymerase-3 subunit epsilon
VAEEIEARRGLRVEDAVFGIVDLETTGLSPAANRILEIGLVIQRRGSVLDRFETLVDIGEPVPAAISALTGIHSGDLRGAPEEAGALAKLAQRLRRWRVDALVAHNARFDRAFLGRAWKVHDQQVPLPPFLCSVQLARRWVRAPRFGLDTLVRQLSIPPRPRHRALGDAEMTADLWYELLKRGKLADVHTLEALRAVGEVGRSRRRRSRRPAVERASQGS